MRIALGQINSVVGDLKGNAAIISKFCEKALQAKADVIVFPELSICGYPPEDLLLKKHFLDDNLATVQQLAGQLSKITAIVGFAERRGTDCHNSAAVIGDGCITNIYRKGLLPNYGVFDEARYFEPGNEPVIIEVGGLRVAVTICRDIWDLEWLRGFLGNSGPIDLIVNISASPFHVGKTVVRQQVIGSCAKAFGASVCYCNTVGGQDELVFDGRSMIANPSGKIVAQAAAFEQDLLIADIERAGKDSVKIKVQGQAAPKLLEPVDEIYRALVLGTRDYTRKNGFEKVLLGLSGGIDSSVVAAVASAALGKENVIGITMPSKFNTDETKSDAAKVAENLGIEFLSIPIQETLEAFDKSLREVSGWDDKSVAYENLQARIRGSILMSLSNQLGALVLTTGNKSETAVGYSTLYGDTAGGFAVIKDVPKTMVYKLAEHINKISGKEFIPRAVIDREPSAELKPDQKDTDSLPDYDLLDKILEGYVEQDKSPKQLIEAGLPKEAVLRTVRMVDRNEYKRRQSPPGIKITPKAFGRDRRLPITNRYRPAIGD
jgi:NAD+ synthase (glutamine-hydrolysing)